MLFLRLAVPSSSRRHAPLHTDAIAQTSSLGTDESRPSVTEIAARTWCALTPMITRDLNFVQRTLALAPAHVRP